MVKEKSRVSKNKGMKSKEKEKSVSKNKEKIGKEKVKVSKEIGVVSKVKEKVKVSKEIGVVSNYFDHVGAASVRLSGTLKIGDRIMVKGGDIEFEMEVKSIQLNKADVPMGKAEDEVGIITDQKVRKGYRVYKLR